MFYDVGRRDRDAVIAALDRAFAWASSHGADAVVLRSSRSGHVRDVKALWSCSGLDP